MGNEVELEKNKMDHIAYILKVAEYCKLDCDTENYKKKLMKLELEEIYRISGVAEKLYEMKMKNKNVDKVWEEIEKNGIEAVRNKYLANS